jgi:putative flippase GtrA
VEFVPETAWQVWWFGCVGAVNTVLDVWLFNRLTSRPLFWRRVSASLASTSAGMMFGFAMNLAFVFQPHEGAVAVRALRFLWVTAISCYVIQTAVIMLGTHYCRQRIGLVSGCGAWLSQVSCIDYALMEKNLIKAMAVAAGMVWNFLWYKFYVFAG